VTATETRAGRLATTARQFVPGGTHSNSRLRDPAPFYAARGEGPYLYDVDGTRHVDFTMGNGAVVLGHAHPGVGRAVREAVDSGLTAGYETAASVEAAALMAEMIPGFGKVRFANTGTEAAMHALRIARAATGRDGVAKVEGAYHGWYDFLWVSCWPPADAMGTPERPASPPASPGLSGHAGETLVLPFNDSDATERLLRERAHDLAAVFVEPVLIDLGFVPARPEWLQTVREVTEDLGVVLVFDELLTGFRLARGGARERYGIAPDLTLYGKALGNGYPIAAVEGRAELLDLTDPGTGGPVGYVGTFNGHAIPLAAAVASLTALRDGSVVRRLEALTARLQEGLGRLGREYGVPVQPAAGGGHFQPYFTDVPVVDYRSATTTNAEHYLAFARAAARRNLIVAEKPLLHGALSAAHAEEHVDELLAAAEEAFAEIGARA